LNIKSSKVSLKEKAAERSTEVQALEGVKVLDLTRLLPGSFTSLMLADYGAEVIMVEHPAGEPGRHIGPFIKGLSARHLLLNRNKKSITLDLKKARGRELLIELAKKADVLIENFRPGYMDGLGLGYSRLKEINPTLIYCSLTGYGQTGPDRDKPGHDINYISNTGILGLTSTSGESLPLPGVQIADLGGGSLMAVMGILVALAARVNTNRGQYVDVSMTDGITSWLPLVFNEYMVSGKVPKPGEHTYTGSLACYNSYRTKDKKYLTLGALEPKFWGAFCIWIGLEEFIPLQKNPSHQSRMIACLQERFSTRTLAEWMTAAADWELCLTPVRTLDEAFLDPRVIAREMIFEVDHPVSGKIKQLGFPVKLSLTPAKYKKGAPLLGEHNGEVFGSIGLDPDHLETLRAEGVI
jgi:crotonobetainyl-CoA:carnitine CoA-transferase CaiB-like acyl-CoA transferase